MNSNDSSEQTSSAPVSRRDFIKSGIVGAGAFALGSSFLQILSHATDARRGAPNILFIICDQWRFPQHLTPEESAFQDARLPNYSWLYQRSVKFFGHYGAAAGCTPVRSTIVTGLYTHQTGILNTYFDNGQKDQANTLNPGFLTWGKGSRCRESGVRFCPVGDAVSRRLSGRWSARGQRLCHVVVKSYRTFECHRRHHDRVLASGGRG
jgi:hypothetical protein